MRGKNRVRAVESKPHRKNLSGGRRNEAGQGLNHPPTTPNTNNHPTTPQPQPPKTNTTTTPPPHPNTPKQKAPTPPHPHPKQQNPINPQTDRGPTRRAKPREIQQNQASSCRADREHSPGRPFLVRLYMTGVGGKTGTPASTPRERRGITRGGGETKKKRRNLPLPHLSERKKKEMADRRGEIKTTKLKAVGEKVSGLGKGQRTSF